MAKDMIRLLAATALLWLSAAVAHAGSIAGNYRCVSYNVSGGGGSCRLAPPLVLNPDGTYRMSSEHGTYKVLGSEVHLSESKLRGAGHINSEGQIVFKYTYKGWEHTVTYARTSSPGSMEASR